MSMNTTKVLAVNSSPNREKGNTASILNPFLDGMKKAGAEVELLYARSMKIGFCLGCLKCWTETPGRCVIKDDMESVLPKVREADIIVLATPLYWDGVSGLMKNFLDRLTPIGQPFIEIRDDRSRHPVREGYGHGKMVLVSTCGYFEIENFEPLLTHMQAIAINTERTFAGALLRPNAMFLKPLMKMGTSFDDIFDAAREAGRQLIADGEMSQETLNIISRDIITRDMFVQSANDYFSQVLEKLESTAP